VTQWQVGSTPPGTRIVSAGDPETLLVNKNTKYSILLGNNAAVGSGNQSDATPLGPYESMVVNGLADLFAIAQTPGTTCLVIAQTNAILWTPKAIQPNIEDPKSPYSTGVGTNTVTLSVPPGAQGLFIAWPPAHSSLTSVIVTGVQSGIQYYDEDPVTEPSLEAWIPILSDADTSVTVQTTSGSGVSLTFVWLMNSFMAGAVNTGMAMDVNIADVSFSGGSIPVSPVIPFDVVETSPAMYSNTESVAISQSLTSGSSAVVLAGVAGHRYYLHELRLEPVVAATMDLNVQDTSGTNIAYLYGAVVGTPAATFRPPIGPISFHGTPLPLGDGLQIMNPTAATQQYVGYVVYSFV
jgi:hypothetical protein